MVCACVSHRIFCREIVLLLSFSTWISLFLFLVLLLWLQLQSNIESKWWRSTSFPDPNLRWKTSRLLCISVVIAVGKCPLSIWKGPFCSLLCWTKAWKSVSDQRLISNSSPKMENVPYLHTIADPWSHILFLLAEHFRRTFLVLPLPFHFQSCFPYPGWLLILGPTCAPVLPTDAILSTETNVFFPVKMSKMKYFHSIPLPSTLVGGMHVSIHSLIHSLFIHTYI